MRVNLELDGETMFETEVDKYGRIAGLTKYIGKKAIVVIKCEGSK